MRSGEDGEEDLILLFSSFGDFTKVKKYITWFLISNGEDQVVFSTGLGIFALILLARKCLLLGGLIRFCRLSILDS